MIPRLDENGYLPPGVHVATLEEVVARFGRGSEQREAQAQSLAWLLPLCRAAGISKLLVNGSFITDRSEPNDVDCVALQGPSYRRHSREAIELRQGLPFIELKVVNERDYQRFRDIVFASDRAMMSKGLIEIHL